MKILLLNWRDHTHPKAGGAEKVTYEVLKHLVSQRHTVTWFAGGFAGAKSEEMIDGIQIIRRGGQATVHFMAWRYFRPALRRDYDVVIDEVNTIPFFTPLYFKEAKRVAYFNQLAREVWFYEFPFPLSLIGYLLEPLYLLPYHRTQTTTISQSTKDDLLKLGFKGAISIFPMTVDPITMPVLPPKEKDLTFIYVGRLAKSKRVHHIIEALRQLDDSNPQAKLWVVGGGSDRYLRQLQRQAKRAGLGNRVVFHGFVSRDEKYDLMARAHAVVVASVREGWGLIATEANMVGTLAIGYNIPGLRDSIQDGVTGYLTRDNRPSELAHLMKKVKDIHLTPVKSLPWAAVGEAFSEAIGLHATK